MSKLFIGLFILLVTQSLNAQSLNPKFDKWKKPSFFRGFNVLNENPKTLQDFIDLKALGANLAHLGCFGFRAVDSPYTIQNHFILQTDSLVMFARQAKLYYTIAVRQGPGRRDVYLESTGLGAKSTIWRRTDEQRLYASMLKDIANRYLPDSLFVGLAIFVEPNPLWDNSAYPPELFQYKLDTAGINMKNIYQIMIDSIRTIDSDLPLILQSVSFASPEYFILMQPQNVPFIVYEFHSYRPKAYTNELTPYTRTYPGYYFSIEYFSNRYYDKNFFISDVYADIRAFQLSYDVPIFLGEFGLAKAQYGGTQFLTDLSDIAVSFGWHFALWDWRRNDGVWDYEAMGLDYINTVRNMFSKPVRVPQNLPVTFDFDVSLYPNPFNSNSKILLTLPYSTSVKFEIINLLGEKIAEKTIEHLSEGNHILSLYEIVENRKFNSGIYLISIQAKKHSKVHKFIVLN